MPQANTDNLVGATDMLKLVNGAAQSLIYLLESAHTSNSWDSLAADDRCTQHVFGNQDSHDLCSVRQKC